MTPAWTRAGLGLFLAAAVSGCAGGSGETDGSHVSMKASVWTDPDGCHHWVIDDGAEGYMSPVLNPDGTPDCT